MKRFRQTLALAAATLVMAIVPAAMAKADPVHIDITNAVMDLGELKKVQAIDPSLDPPDPPATLDGTITGNDVVIPKAGFVFPPKEAEVSPGTTATINMEANEDMTGTFDSATGSLVLDVSLKATVAISGSNCVISPIVLQLTTSNYEPYLGEAFTTGLTGPGAFTASWESLPAVTGGGFCSVVGQLIAGPGGIWMAQDLLAAESCDDVPPPDDPRCAIPTDKPPTQAPRIISSPQTTTDSTTATFTFAEGTGETEPVTGFKCSLDGSAFEVCTSGKTYTGLTVGSHKFEVKASNGEGDGPVSAPKTWSVTKKTDRKGEALFGSLKITPKAKTVKRGKKATLTAKISNVGDEAAKGVKICVTAPKKLVSVKKCATIGSIAAGGSASAKFKVTVKKKAKKGKKAALKFKATGTGLGAKTATAKVKIK